MDAEVSSLRSTFESKSRKQHASILVRDYAEAGAGLAVSVVYAFFWRQIGNSGWPMAVAIVLILAVSGLFLRERVRARRSRLGTDAPLLAKVDHDIAELKHQCRLLRSLWTWYLGPCALAISIQIGVIYRRSAPWGPLRDPWVLLGFAVFFAIVLWIAWVINQNALKNRLLPRLEELEKLRRDLSRTN